MNGKKGESDTRHHGHETRVRLLDKGQEPPRAHKYEGGRGDQRIEDGGGGEWWVIHTMISISNLSEANSEWKMVAFAGRFPPPSPPSSQTFNIHIHSYCSRVIWQTCSRTVAWRPVPSNDIESFPNRDRFEHDKRPLNPRLSLPPFIPIPRACCLRIQEY